MKIRRTFDQFMDFADKASIWRAREQNAQTKLGYAITKVLPRIAAVQRQHADLVEDARVEHASVDEKGLLITDPGGNYRFKKDEWQKCLKRLRALRGEMLFEIEPYFATSLPCAENLSEEEREAMLGIVIDPDGSAISEPEMTQESVDASPSSVS